MHGVMGDRFGLDERAALESAGVRPRLKMSMTDPWASTPPASMSTT
jgi:hypothetical protein